MQLNNIQHYRYYIMQDKKDDVYYLVRAIKKERLCKEKKVKFYTLILKFKCQFDKFRRCTLNDKKFWAYGANVDTRFKTFKKRACKLSDLLYCGCYSNVKVRFFGKRYQAKDHLLRKINEEIGTNIPLHKKSEARIEQGKKLYNKLKEKKENKVKEKNISKVSSSPFGRRVIRNKSLE